MMKRWLRRWLLREGKPLGASILGAPDETNAHSHPDAPHCRVGVLSVMNGRVLEVCSFKRNPHGPDWTTTYWILDDTQSLAEQIAVVLTMKGLEK